VCTPGLPTVSRVTITNYDPAYTWSGSATRGGSVSFSGTLNNGLATITGVAADTGSVATINTSRTGYQNGTVASASTNSLGAALTPSVSSVTSSLSGFAFDVTNYDSAYTFSLSSTSGTATAGTPSGKTLPITVTGLSAGQSTTVSISTTRSGYAAGSMHPNGFGKEFGTQPYQRHTW